MMRCSVRLELRGWGWGVGVGRLWIVDCGLVDVMFCNLVGGEVWDSGVW